MNNVAQNNSQSISEVLPAQMVESDEWVVRDADKLPYSPHTEKKGRTFLPGFTASFEKAEEVAKSPLYAGVGFVFSERTEGFVFIDLDKCIDESGCYSELAEKVLSLCPDTYAEVSPSGEGLHIFGHGFLAGGQAIKEERFEVYSTGRYSTVTGDVLEERAGKWGSVQKAVDYLQKYRNEKSKVIPLPQGKVGEGGRNNALHKAATREWKGGSKSAEELLSWMKEWNKTMTSSPLPESEVEGIWRSVIKYERGSEWPEVEPLQTATDPTPYPLQVLPRRIREAIEQGHASTQAPLPLVACALFSAGSAAIQSIVEAVRPYFSGCERATIPAVLWFLSVAESGERKTTTDRLFSAPIKERGRTEHPCWQKVIGDREVIRHKRVWVDDVTAEGVRDHLYDVFPAIFCSTTEGGKFLGGHSLRDSQRAQGLGAYNSLWDGEGSSVARAGKRTKYLPNVRGVLSISIQPSIVESVHGHDFTDSGFYPRFLICQPESTIGKRFIGEDSKETRNDAALQAMRGTIRDLFDLEEQWDDTTGFIKQFRELELDNDAAQLWRGFFNKVEEAQAPGGKLEGLRGFASKAAEQVLRVSAVLHLLEYSTAGLQKRVSAETMTAAQAVVRYHLNEAQRLLEAVRPGGTDTRAAVALEKWLVEQSTGGRKVSTREVSQFGPSPCRHKEARDKAIQILESYGRARAVREGKQKLLEVNPEVLEEYRNG